MKKGVDIGDSDNIWYRYSNEPLKRSLERFAKFPIATTKEGDQPRLLLVAVDVAVDFSLETIKVLFERGYNDALDGFKEYIESKEEQPTESIEDGRM